MSCSTPGLPVHHQLPEFTQTHVHQVSDAIQHFLQGIFPSQGSKPRLLCLLNWQVDSLPLSHLEGTLLARLVRSMRSGPQHLPGKPQWLGGLLQGCLRHPKP